MPDAPYFSVPLVIGHSEDQEWLQDSGLPAWGWVTDLYRDDDLLRLDVGDLAKEIADLIRARRYATVSVEFYDDPPGTCPGEGLTLRRVAILGGDLPQVKGLASIPMPDGSSIRGLEAFQAGEQRGKLYTGADLDAAVRNFRALSMPNGKPPRGARFSERFAPSPRARLRLAEVVSLPGGFAAFSEVRSMPEMMTAPGQKDAAAAPDRDAHLQKLAEHGMDMAAVDERTPDHTLAEMVRVCDSKDQPHEMDEEEEKWAAPKDDEEKQAFREKWKRYAEVCSRRLARYSEDGDDVLKKVGEEEGAHKMSEDKLVRRVLAALAKEGKGQLAELQRFHEQTVAAERKRSVEAFCEQQAQAGRLLPIEYRPKSQGGPGGPIFEQLMRADAREKVVKFSERGKTLTLTEIEAQMKAIEQRPTRFGELVKQPLTHRGGASGTDDEAEVEKVARFSETAHMRDALEAAGKTPEEFVEEFRKARKERPRLTATMFGVPKEFAGD